MDKLDLKIMQLKGTNKVDQWWSWKHKNTRKKVKISLLGSSNRVLSNEPDLW